MQTRSLRNKLFIVIWPAFAIATRAFSRRSLPNKLFIVIWALIVISAFITCFSTKPSRDQYFDSSVMATNLPSPIIETSLEAKIKAYKDFRAALTKDIYLAGVVLVLSIILLYKNKATFRIPGIAEDVPIRLIYFVAPFIAFYAWFQFGYDLNSCLDLRISSYHLINAQLETEIRPFRPLLDGKPLSDPITVMEYTKAYHSFTHAYELEDSGLLDDWLLIYGPTGKTDYDQGGYHSYKFIPFTILLFYAALFGGLHACQIVFPYLIWHDHRKDGDWLLGCLLAIFMAIFLLMSHWTFYFTGRNWNWWQPCALSFGLLFFILFSDPYFGHSVASRMMKKPCV